MKRLTKKSLQKPRKSWDLPVDYTTLSAADRRSVRDQYVREQGGNCQYCEEPLEGDPPTNVTDMKIYLKLFPPGFLKYPIHLHHDHETGDTIGAVHAYCNAVLWQYYGE